MIGHGKTESSLHPQDTAMQRSTFHHGHKEPPAPSPPRAIASLSVRVLGQPDHQGLSPVVPRTHEKEGTAPSEPGSAHPVLHLSRSAGLPAGGHAKEDSDEDDSNDNESEDDEDWGPGSGGAQRDNKAYPQPQKMPLSVPSTFARSKRKLQPPQHIPPPPQPHHSPMQLRHPTPPPSPPSDLFPLPDTPKQSPPDTGDSEGEGPEVHGQRMVPFPPPTIQRQDSNSTSHSSSPEPPVKRRPGPLSLLVHKMESERASRSVEASSAVDLSGETVNPNAKPAGSNKSTQQKTERQSLQESQYMEEERRSKEEKDEKQRMIKEQEGEKKRLEEEKKRERKRLDEEEKLHQKEQQERKHQEQEKERKHQGEKKEEERQDQEGEKVQKFQREETASKEKVVSVSESQESDSSSDSDSKSDSSSHSSQSSSSPSRNKTHPARHLEVSDQTDRT